MRKRWIVPFFGTMAAFVLALGAMLMLADSTSAVGIEPYEHGTVSQFHDGGGRSCAAVDRHALLANALGITVEQLNAAHQRAHDQAIQEALNQGLITQAQADAMWNRTSGHRGFGRGWHNNGIDRQTLLANELGISVEQLQAAQATAHAQGIEQAVAAGCITQERADQIQSRQSDETTGHRGSRGGRGRH